MEISGKVLREVEFRDRLRGYDTDEVDEFLEKVALGVDEMRAELVSLRQQLSDKPPVRRVEEAPPQPVAIAPTLDDESIRRTLVLAQRTADLAISEAKEEAGQLVEDARSQAEHLVTQAQDSAKRLREEAEHEARERVERLTDQRDRLERDIQSLAQLLGTERDRLTQSLKTALGFVTESLSLSDEMSRVVQSERTDDDIDIPSSQPTASYQPPSAPTAYPEPSNGSLLPDVDAEIQEDARAVYSDEPFVAPARRPGDIESTLDTTDTDLDPDEALWARWAQGENVDLPNGNGSNGDGSDTGEARQFPFPHRSGPN